MVISMDINSVDIYKYIFGDLKFVWGLRVHKCAHNVEFYEMLTKMKHIFL